MTARLPRPPAPGPLEAYVARFDDLFTSLAQRRGFREYLTGLLAPRDRHKTLTALAGAAPIVQAQHPAVQRLQFCPNRSGTPRRSTPDACRCFWPRRPPPRTSTGCRSSTTPPTANTVRPPRTWAANGWAGGARPTPVWPR